MNDMTSTIIPKSDQLNSDDLISGPITIKITGVTIRGGQEQPVSIHYEGDNGKPYKSCKSMNRAMVIAWGADASKYVGRSMTLYRDPKVKWAGMEVGGIRISHMSDIGDTLVMALTATKGSRKPFTVKPLKPSSAPAALRPDTSSTSGIDSGVAEPVYVTVDQALTLETRCSENGISPEALKKKAGVDRISLILAADFDKATRWIDGVIAKRKESQT